MAEGIHRGFGRDRHEAGPPVLRANHPRAAAGECYSENDEFDEKGNLMDDKEARGKSYDTG